MRFGSQMLFAGLAAFILATSGAAAQEAIPLAEGTYSQNREWCKMNRADPTGPDYKNKRAFINLTQGEINWNESVGKITNVTIERNKINLAIQMTAQGSTTPINLTLVRKSKKIFALTGVNFFHCSTYMPNPWLGR